MGFFGVVLEPGQKDALEVPIGWRLQLCSAVLETKTKKPDKVKDAVGALWVEVEEEDGEETSYLLGRLQGDGNFSQVALTHSFSVRDGMISFEARGSGAIHLTGYFTQDVEDGSGGGEFDSDDDEEEEEEKEEENVSMKGSRGADPSLARKKAAHVGQNGRAPRAAAAAAVRSWSDEAGKGEEDADEEDDDYVDEGDEDEDEDEDGEEGDTSMAQSVSEDEEDKSLKAGRAKSVKRGTTDTSASARPAAKRSRSDEDDSTPKGQGGDAEASTEMSEAEKKERRRERRKENKKKATEAKRAMNEAFAPEENKKEAPVDVPLKKPSTRTHKGGLKTTDIVIGSGAEAHQGKNVEILYQGTFPNGKVFDKNQNRKRPLKFRMGMKQVIAGMDRGLQGMRVGGVRKIEVPSALGYGEQKTGPIPPNQDLVFEVELLKVLGKK